MKYCSKQVIRSPVIKGIILIRGAYSITNLSVSQYADREIIVWLNRWLRYN